MQKHVNLVDLVKSFPTNIFLQDLASIQQRTSPIKFAHLAGKSEKGSISNLLTKAMGEIFYEIIFQEKIPPLKTITTMQHLKTVKLMMKDQVVDAKKIVAQLIISPAEADKVEGYVFSNSELTNLANFV